MEHVSLPRLVLALKGYFILRRTWRCAWAMAARWPAAVADRPVPLFAAPQSPARPSPRAGWPRPIIRG